MYACRCVPLFSHVSEHANRSVGWLDGAGVLLAGASIVGSAFLSVLLDGAGVLLAGASIVGSVFLSVLSFVPLFSVGPASLLHHASGSPLLALKTMATCAISTPASHTRTVTLSKEEPGPGPQSTPSKEICSPCLSAVKKIESCPEPRLGNRWWWWIDSENLLSRNHPGTQQDKVSPPEACLTSHNLWPQIAPFFYLVCPYCA